MCVCACVCVCVCVCECVCVCVCVYRGELIMQGAGKLLGLRYRVGGNS